MDTETRERRNDFRMEFYSCFICGNRWEKKPIRILDVHEIARGAFRSKAIMLRECWLLLCRECHDAVDDYSEWPIAKQLAVKYIRDREYYDRALVNRIRGRTDDAITETEVHRYVEAFTKERELAAGEALYSDI